jgi:predicted aspartyl protease
LSFLLGFSKAHGYAGPSDSITLPVLLRAGDNEVELVASLDTGASYCLFERSVAEALGLDVGTGVSRVFTTANSRLQAFGHEVAINVLGIEVHSMAFFFADTEIEKNVLGRRGWLDRVRIGIVDHDQMLYVAGYDEPIADQQP